MKKTLIIFISSIFVTTVFAAINPNEGLMNMGDKKCIAIGNAKDKKILQFKPTTLERDVSLLDGSIRSVRCDAGKCPGSVPGAKTVQLDGIVEEKGKLCCGSIKMGKNGPECGRAEPFTDRADKPTQFVQNQNSEKPLADTIRDGFKHGDQLPKDFNNQDIKDMNKFMSDPQNNPIPPRLYNWACSTYQNANCPVG